MNGDIIATCLCGKHNLDTIEIKVIQFLMQSNAIENEFSLEAIEDAQKAWEYASTLKNLTVRDVLKIHGLLMARLRPDIAGQIRKVGVTVGGHDCPNPGSVRRLLNQWIPQGSIELRNDIKGIKEDICQLTHVAFEKIHPFEDGNGRTGRILFNWHRLKNGLPLMIIHTGDEQRKYYKWFKNIN